jgi:nucleotide-binding universal stress UspA family protein
VPFACAAAAMARPDPMNRSDFMLALRTILCPVDFSERSQIAFGVACNLGRVKGARVLVLYVVERPLVGEEVVAFTESGKPIFVPVSCAEHQDDLQEQLRDRYVPDHALDVDYLTREGTPAEQILRFADETACDLIVMGTHGRKGIDRALTGSVAEAVLRGARCPVVTARVGKYVSAVGAASTVACTTSRWTSRH